MMNVLSYVLALGIGIVAIVLGATQTPGKWYLLFGITTVLAVIWTSLWKGRGQMGFDIKEKSIFAKFTEVGEAVTIPVIAAYVIMAVIGFATN